MKKFIVSTTINPPTPAIKLYDAMPDWHLVVAGDRKTPADYRLERGTYLSPDDQRATGFNVLDELPWDSLSRRNIATLYALREGADVVAFVDDDNIPHRDWATKSWSRLVCNPCAIINSHILTGAQCVDPLAHTLDAGGSVANLWHRGFPIQMLAGRHDQKVVRRAVANASLQGQVNVQAGLWDGEPDVDAVCRIAQGPFDVQLQFFGMHPGIDVQLGSFAPFNTQNTVVTRAVAKCMALLPNVGRMDDIWASYMVQRAMWEHGMTMSYTTATVTQRRNEHDLTHDLAAEMLGHERSLELIKGLHAHESIRGKDLVETFRNSVQRVLDSGILMFDPYDVVASRFYGAWFRDLCMMEQ